ncbi:16S rRNA (cytidine(1402)-2'-O)-methyltransferase [Halomonas halocynthiae]|uniref:16S rRNA (cytidine(1402)-2'-O)-methyltransferase n=1 Tax=Halomonas halocynthiae TaxID=176290 RepID=UPI000427A340|nr:16S rRNA (cytidine(1402)-2'-O)-methyltransferase [Halomonas halocynthiae]
MSDAVEGTLYVVATPIGNLEDLSPRAARLLGEVALIAAEDTRHSAGLLRHLGVRQPMLSLHEHNEAERVDQLDARLLAGDDVALISDAGTPLISDPGFVLVRELRQRGRVVSPVPGPCALVAALSAAGLPTDRFLFSGFLPAKGSARRKRLGELTERQETLVFYESPHRIRATLDDLVTTLGDRHVVLARELTKRFETLLDGTPAQLVEQLSEDPDQSRGEFVVMVAGGEAQEEAEQTQLSADSLLNSLLEEGLGVKQTAAVAVRVLGGTRKQWYQRAQLLKDRD